MRRLHEDKRYHKTDRKYDDILMSLQPDEELIEIVRQARSVQTFRLDNGQVKFLKKEAKRLGWTKSETLRGIINLYMEEVGNARKEKKYPIAQAREAAKNGDAKYWTGD